MAERDFSYFLLRDFRRIRNFVERMFCSPILKYKRGRGITASGFVSNILGLVGNCGIKLGINISEQKFRRVSCTNLHIILEINIAGN